MKRVLFGLQQSRCLVPVLLRPRQAAPFSIDCWYPTIVPENQVHSYSKSRPPEAFAYPLFRRNFTGNNNNDSDSIQHDMEQYLSGDPKDTTTEQLITIMKKRMSSLDTSSYVERAHDMDKLLQRWLVQYDSGNERPKTSLPFELTLEAWHEAGCGDDAAMVLDQWGHLLEGDMTLEPSLQAFHLVMDAYSKTTCTKEALETVENLLLLLEQWHTAGTVWCQPQVETYAHVLRVMTRHYQKERSGEEQPKTKVVLTKLVQAFSNKENVQPIDVYFLARSYSDVIAASTNDTTSHDLMVEMESLLDGHDLEVVARQLDGSDNTTGEEENLETCLGRTYQSVMQATRDSQKERDAVAKQIDDVVLGLERLGWLALPWPLHYQVAIVVWADVAKSLASNQANDSTVTLKQAQTQCEELLHRMETRHLQNVDASSVATVSVLPLEAYEPVLHTMSCCKQSDEAESLLFHMMELTKQGLVDTTPVETLTRCWNHVMMAHWRTNNLDAVLTLWREMKQALVPSDSITYAKVLEVLAKSDQPHAAQRAHSIWKQMRKESPRPNAVHYGHVIAAWSRSSRRNAAQQAQAVLDTLVNEYEKNPLPQLKPRLADYTAVIVAWGRSRHSDRVHKAQEVFERIKLLALLDEDFEPDAVVYGAVMDAWSKQKGPEAARKAQELLDHMETVSKQPGHEHTKPNKQCYTSAMIACGKSGDKDAPERAQAIFQRLLDAYSDSQDESLRPDAFVYSAMLGVWAHGNYSHAGTRAEELLKRFEEDTDGSALLNTVVYTNVIKAHWKSGRPDAGERAEAILNRMENLYSNGQVHVKPDTVAYTCTINAWARSASPQKAQHAWNLLQRMRHAYESGSLDVTPNVVAVTAVLNACAHTRGSRAVREEAVKIALTAMTELYDGKHSRPNHIAFRTLLTVFGRQVSDESELSKLTSSVFETCARDGQVDGSVVNALQKFVPKLHKELPRDSTGQLSLPDEWSRNVESR